MPHIRLSFVPPAAPRPLPLGAIGGDLLRAARAILFSVSARLVLVPVVVRQTRGATRLPAQGPRTIYSRW